jgi:hypothetical protein
MRTIIQFLVTHDGGIYTADGVNVPVVTEGATFEELQANVRDAAALFFEGENPSSLGFSSFPAILPSATKRPWSSLTIPRSPKALRAIYLQASRYIPQFELHPRFYNQ